MNRRDFLQTTPAAALAPTALLAAEPENEIAMLFREWQAVNDFVASHDLSDDETAAQADIQLAVEARMMAFPAQTARDLAKKLWAHTHGDIGIGCVHDGGDLLHGELRRLAGVSSA